MVVRLEGRAQTKNFSTKTSTVDQAEDDVKGASQRLGRRMNGKAEGRSPVVLDSMPLDSGSLPVKDCVVAVCAAASPH